ncbi:F-box associated interaction domain-containing protein [Dioscorea alata]|uniref:F-box associated interaction domain-containing protein n=4 Tax=Dioscorea alata TaxID=55571 RepID=A0ACB7UWY0_DIOAL|nr:F-box associated interaction domain-containing protein [Dioscorea alata]KAH7665393.1 F-box associated interaction domain-containing protein [Dioscorea alata]KAH7665394.1 F-box associated interaction domain-containing protein [Dioscorea alata]KAH7665395.1 F-box associated interaction domain-containing protein [Dioscorea alata]
MEVPKKSNTANRLTDDILINILIRLPPKSLCKFMVISKAWHSLISDAYFRALLPPTMTGLFYNFRCLDPNSGYYKISNKYLSIPSWNHGFVDTTLSFLPYPGKFEILDSCNGLLYCQLEDSPSSDIFVCNPVARSWTLLTNVNLHLFDSLFLVFDPKFSLQFQLVGVQTNGGSSCVELEKFSSQTCSWEKFQVSTKIGTNFIPHSRRVYLNGIIHIVASKRHMVAIDLDSMVCRRIEMPVITPLIRNALLGNLTGSLHYADKRNKEMNVWMLKDYESGEWVLKHSVVFEVGFNVMAFHPEMDIVFLRMFNNKIMSYKMSNGELKEVCKLMHRSMRGFFVFSPFFGEDVLENKFGA